MAAGSEIIAKHRTYGAQLARRACTKAPRACASHPRCHRHSRTRWRLNFDLFDLASRTPLDCADRLRSLPSYPTSFCGPPRTSPPPCRLRVADSLAALLLDEMARRECAARGAAYLWTSAPFRTGPGIAVLDIVLPTRNRSKPALIPLPGCAWGRDADRRAGKHATQASCPTRSSSGSTRNDRAASWDAVAHLPPRRGDLPAFDFDQPQAIWGPHGREWTASGGSSPRPPRPVANRLDLDARQKSKP